MHMLDSNGELWMPRDRPAHMGGMVAPTGLDIHIQKHPRYISDGHMGMMAYEPPPSPRDIFQGLSPHHADGVGLKVVDCPHLCPALLFPEMCSLLMFFAQRADAR